MSLLLPTDALWRGTIYYLEPTAIIAVGSQAGREMSGNPFFVTEVLASGKASIPSTVRDAVLARAARLSAGARKLLEAVAIAPPQVELWLLEELAGDDVGRLEECLTSGMLTSESDAVAFRHELARLAVEESLPPNRTLSLHRQAVSALSSSPGGAQDLTRLAHHAEAAGDVEAVLRFAPAAAERAASLGAHREAAAQYARALRFGDGLPPAERATLLERLSFECYLTDQSTDAIAALERAVELHRQLGDARKEGAALCALSRRVWCAGVTEQAERTAREAISVLECLPPSRELAIAYSTVSSDHMNAEDAEAALEWGARALDLADRFDDTETRVHALNNVGTIESLSEVPGGFEKLEQSLRLAQHAGLEEHVGRAFIHLA